MSLWLYAGFIGVWLSAKSDVSLSAMAWPLCRTTATAYCMNLLPIQLSNDAHVPSGMEAYMRRTIQLSVAC